MIQQTIGFIGLGAMGQNAARRLLGAGYRVQGFDLRQSSLDAFLDAGALPTLHDRYGISTDAMVASVKGWL